MVMFQFVMLVRLPGRVMTILGLIDSHHDQSIPWLLTTDPSPSANFAHIFRFNMNPATPSMDWFNGHPLTGNHGFDH
jgi:hypothetical protein